MNPSFSVIALQSEPSAILKINYTFPSISSISGSSSSISSDNNNLTLSQSTIDQII